MSLMLLTFQLFRPLAGPFFLLPSSHQPARPTTIYLAGLSSFILFYFIFFVYMCARPDSFSSFFCSLQNPDGSFGNCPSLLV